MLRNASVVETRRDFSSRRSHVPKERGSAGLLLEKSPPVRPQAGLTAAQHPTWDNPEVPASSWPWSWEGDRDCALSFHLNRPRDQLPHFLSLRQNSLPKTTGKSRLWWQNTDMQTLSPSSVLTTVRGFFWGGVEWIL